MFFGRKPRRYRKPAPWQVALQMVFQLQPQQQYVLIVVSAIVMAALIFSGALLFRQADQGDQLTRGEWYMKQGKTALAVKEFEEMVRQHPRSYKGHLALGNAYLAVEELDKAAKEYRVASGLKSRNLKESGAHIAMARLMIAQYHFDDAEKQLVQAFKANKKNRHNRELLSAMVTLYEKWGDFYLKPPEADTAPDYEEAFLKYSTGLRYVKTYNEQSALQDKMGKTAQKVADHYVNMKEYDKAVAVLKRAFHYERNVETVMAIGTIYEKQQDLDPAIKWYRRAYEIEPEMVSMKLSTLLIERGNALNSTNQIEEAKTYFDEAQQINRSVRLPADKLFPVKASKVTITYDYNKAEGTIRPKVTFAVSNQGDYPLRFLVAKAQFSSAGVPFSDVQLPIVNSDEPLSPKGESNNHTNATLKASNAIPLADLKEGKLQVELMVTYGEQGSSRWFPLKNVETYVPESKAHLPQESEEFSTQEPPNTAEEEPLLPPLPSFENESQ